MKVSFMILVQFLFFMAFMKFYRRFTLESFVCMVSMELEKEKEDTTNRKNTCSLKLTFIKLLKNVFAKKC